MVPLDAVEVVVVVVLREARLQAEAVDVVVVQVPVVVPLSANRVLPRLTVLQWNRRRLHARRWAKQSRSNQSQPERLAQLGQFKNRKSL